MNKRDGINKKPLCVGAICSLVSLFTACELPGPSPGSGGKAVVSIQIESGIPGRTVRPNAALEDVSAWKLRGGKRGDTETPLLEFADAAGQTIALEPGEWSFTLEGYKDSAYILSGSIASQTISLEGTQTLAFEVAPVGSGEGTVNLVIELPAASGITEARVFKDGIELETSPIALAGDTIVFAETSDAGAYYYSVKLYKGDKLIGVVSEMVHVRANLESAKTYALAQKDLNLVYTIKYHVWDEAAHAWDDMDDEYYQIAATKPLAERPTRGVYSIKGWYEQPDFSGKVLTQIPVGSTGDRDFYAKWIRTFSGSSLADALVSINAGQEAEDEYLIILKDDEPWTTTHDLTATGGKEIAVTIDGNGKTISMDPNGNNGSLLTLGAESGSSLTLVLEDVTLKGKDSNNAPVVQVKDGATLDLQDGSSLTGNTSSASGGGVSVADGGTLTISGGTISGNTSSSGDGGGVSVAYGGALAMSGGEIRDNTSSGISSRGGGVYINGGTFTMTGGKISGNSSNQDGGGVFISGGGALFTMTGGEISGNEAKYGGGVYANNNGKFTMSGGVVYGSEAEASKKNTATAGAMIYLYLKGSATLGGATSGSRDTTIDLR